VADGGAAVPGIVSTVERQGLAIAAVTVARPSLDDVYLHHTGRDFRADDRTTREAA
jgi:ABC-2 type transport system ATP-binding protein